VAQVLAALRPHDPPGPDAVDKVWLALRPADKDAREVRSLFGQYDEDNSGTISSQELEKILCEVVFDQGRLAARSPTRAQEELTAVAEDYLRRFDATGRGELNCDQVLQLYESCLQRPDISAAAKLKSESLSWEDFLRGLPAARADPEVGHMLGNLSRPNEWELVSLYASLALSPLPLIFLIQI
jgi:hypothetical protein